MDFHGFAWIEHGFGMDLATFARSYPARGAFARIFGLFGLVWARWGAVVGKLEPKLVGRPEKCGIYKPLAS